MMLPPRAKVLLEFFFTDCPPCSLFTYVFLAGIRPGGHGGEAARQCLHRGGAVSGASEMFVSVFLVGLVCLQLVAIFVFMYMFSERIADGQADFAMGL